MKNKQSIAAITLLLAVISSGCKPKQQIAEVKDEKIKVEVAVAEFREVDNLGTFTATVEAQVQNMIAPQQGGRIKKIYAEVGDRVARGQKMAEMDDVNLEQTRLQMENYQLEFDRVDELYEVGGVSKSAWDTRKLAYELSAKTYQNLIENTTLVSPISGIVTERNYDNGDMFSMGDPIYIVAQIQPVKLVVPVSEILFTKVKKGMPVEVKFDVYGDETFDGTVSLIYPSVDPGTRTFQVEVRIQNQDSRVRPGMFARATFNYGKEECVMISDRAVLKLSGSGERYVYIAENGQAQYRKIVPGRLVGSEYEVLEGIAPGEQVVMTGQGHLADGVQVEIVNH